MEDGRSEPSAAAAGHAGRRYCSIVEFAPGELGEPLSPADMPPAARPRPAGERALMP